LIFRFLIRNSALQNTKLKILLHKLSHMYFSVHVCALVYKVVLLRGYSEVI
jgi:hypothetical protein